MNCFVCLIAGICILKPSTIFKCKEKVLNVVLGLALVFSNPNSLLSLFRCDILIEEMVGANTEDNLELSQSLLLIIWKLKTIYPTM